VLKSPNTVLSLHVGEGPDSNYGLLLTKSIRTDINGWMTQ
jgi:hypothetical protein